MAEFLKQTIGAHVGAIQECINSQQAEQSLVGRVAGRLAGGPIGPQAGSLPQVGMNHGVAGLHPGMGQQPDAAG